MDFVLKCSISPMLPIILNFLLQVCCREKYIGRSLFINLKQYQNNIFNQLKFTNYEKENMEKMCMYDWSSSFCGNGFECQ